MVHVSQKSSRVFIFKFETEPQMHNVLVRGTYYIEKNSLLVHAWGTNVHSDIVKSIPLWVKFEAVPDYYWTRRGLSFLASTIAPPLGADDLILKLEILPYARMCVNYTLGEDLPEKISVTDLDPTTGEKRIVEVLVSYPNKPLICRECKALGHIARACPITKPWVNTS